MNLHELAPSLPRFQASWRPIQIEPIPNSGERITIAIAAVGADGTRVVEPAFDAKQLKCLYGTRWTAFRSVISRITSDLQDFLDTHGDLAEWEPGFEIVVDTPVRQGAADDMIGILDQAVLASASLCQPFSERDTSTDDAKLENWRKTVNGALREMSRLHRPRLGYELTLSHDHYATQFDYYSPKLAAQYSYVSHAGARRAFSMAKTRIFDLENLIRDEFSAPEQAEIIVGVADGMLNRKETGDVLDQLHHYATIRNLGFFVAETPQVAVQHIHKAAA